MSLSRIEQLKAFLKESPADPFLHHALALEYVKKGDLQAALQSFLYNRHHEPDYVPTYYHLARLYEQLKEKESAVKTYLYGMEKAQKAGDQHSYNELLFAYEDLTDE